MPHHFGQAPPVVMVLATEPAIVRGHCVRIGAQHSTVWISVDYGQKREPSGETITRAAPAAALVDALYLIKL
jgi:hypothetical protein